MKRMADVRRQLRVVENTKTDYVVGTAVTKTAPLERSERRKRYYQDGQRVHATPGMLRRERKALKMSLSYVIVMGICCALMAAILVGYVEAKNEVTAQKEMVANTKAQITTLRTENNIIASEVNGYKDFEHIARVATEELGMVPANKNQIQYYENTESEYMMQYMGVPEN